MRYWEQSDNASKQRKRVHVAFLPSGESGMRAAVGPHRDVLLQLFRTRQVPSQEVMKFLNSLAPQNLAAAGTTRFRERNVVFAPVSFMMCHIPEIYADLDVLLALATTQCENIFNERGCQAVLKMAADSCSNSLMVRVVFAGVEVLNLVGINLSMNEGNEVALWWCSWTALFVCSLDVCIYLLQIVGYVSKGLIKQAIADWFHGASLFFNLCYDAGAVLFRRR